MQCEPAIQTAPTAEPEGQLQEQGLPEDWVLDVRSLGKMYQLFDRPLDRLKQAMSLGRDAAWVGLPGEIFVELGLAIKKRSPFAQTFVIELANENLGYIPDRRSYAEGQYEPESSRCAPGSGEKLGVSESLQVQAECLVQRERVSTPRL